jgi:hypothetical protein
MSDINLNLLLAEAKCERLRAEVAELYNHVGEHGCNIANVTADNARLRAALELIAAPKRPDGTYNRSREACEQIAKAALEGK